MCHVHCRTPHSEDLFNTLVVFCVPVDPSLSHQHRKLWEEGKGGWRVVSKLAPRPIGLQWVVKLVSQARPFLFQQTSTKVVATA